MGCCRGMRGNEIFQILVSAFASLGGVAPFLSHKKKSKRTSFLG